MYRLCIAYPWFGRWNINNPIIICSNDWCVHCCMRDRSLQMNNDCSSTNYSTDYNVYSGSFHIWLCVTGVSLYAFIVTAAFYDISHTISELCQKYTDMPLTCHTGVSFARAWNLISFTWALLCEHTVRGTTYLCVALKPVSICNIGNFCETELCYYSIPNIFDNSESFWRNSEIGPEMALLAGHNATKSVIHQGIDHRWRLRWWKWDRFFTSWKWTSTSVVNSHVPPNTWR